MYCTDPHVPRSEIPPLERSMRSQLQVRIAAAYMHYLVQDVQALSTEI